MKFRTWISKITLSALALGAFFSCGPKQPQDPYPQDRVVGVIGFPVASNLDSTWLAQNPDSSGWKLHWTRPSDTTGIAIYIFLTTDTQFSAQNSKLVNGQSPDSSSVPFVAKISASDTSWQIPSLRLDHRQGKALRTDVHYYFWIWVEYQNGPKAPEIPHMELFLGDDIPPQLPFVIDSVGQRTAVLRFGRPRDQTSRYDTSSRGPLKMVRALFWPGATPQDSAGKVRYIDVPQATLANATVDSFRLFLDTLNYYTTYCYALEIADTAGNVVRSDWVSFTTMDQFPPAAPSSLNASFVRLDSAVFTWQAASDTFQSNASARNAYPNYRIQRYVVRVNGQRVDSVELDQDVSSFSSSRDTTIGRFQWNGSGTSTWTWYWRSFRPGKPYQVDLIAYDVSGNAADSVPSVAGTAQTFFSIPGPCDPGWVGVRKDSAGISNFCIEEHEHLSGSKISTRVTWAQAEATCEAAGANLCSEAQWVRACETFPDSTSAIASYGAIEAGYGTSGDTLNWLQQYCQVGTGDSVAMLDPANTNPRCVSGWGVYDMPGRVGEWTRDVYLTDTSLAVRQSGTLAYLGASDLTGQADLGTIHGGSALILVQSEATLASARCRERNYPASSQVDTIAGTLSTRFHPFPQGMSSAWGFRCCKLLP